jgi:tetratricopeptide (TPR) repeat protein
MSDFLARLIPRSAVVVLLALTLAAVVAFAAVSHLVTRFNLNQQARGHKLYIQGLAEMNAGNAATAIDAFRAALTCDRGNPQYQLSLGRALRDTGRLDEAESYLSSLWERSPEDGTINLALARVAARRGSIDDAIRYYHNAMYGVWSSDSDVNRRNARIELIDFLLQKNARVQAQSELVALTAALPPDPALHLRAAQLLVQAQVYPDALTEYEKVLQADRGNAAAFAGAGAAAYRFGRYRTAARYLQDAVHANSQDATSRTLLDSANLILATDPFIRRISDAERNRRIAEALATAGERLTDCAQKKGITLDSDVAKNIGSSSNPGAPFLAGVAKSGAVPSNEITAEPLTALHARWIAMKRELPRLRSAAETDLPDAIMDLVFQIEQQTTNDCGEPQGADEALLLISRDRQAADQ